MIDDLGKALGAGFDITRELPPGGMSRVFIAQDLTLARDVVVKVLAGDVSGISTDRFRQEIQLLARLQHPHVVPILSAGVVLDRPWYTMPFVQGESVRARIEREGALPVVDTVRILRDTLDALAFAHEQGVIHRDIKPDNILLSTGHAVVADFGIAKALSAAGFATTAGVALGTPAYMAPEQALADSNADHRVDLYAVGAVAYEMLSGTPPFSGSPQQIIAGHLTQAPPALVPARRDVPDELRALVLQALAKDASDRPQSARVMVAALDRILGRLSGDVITAPVPPRPRAKTRTILTLLGVSAIAAVGGWWALRPDVTRAARAIAIMPLSAPSGDTALLRLGRDLASTVSLTLDGVGALSVADPAATNTLASRASQPLTTSSAVSIARTLGSTSLLTGTVVRTGEAVRIDLLLRDAEDTTTVFARSTITGSVANVSALSDSVAWTVLRAIWQRGTPPSPSLVSVTTASLPALRAFLEGERLWQSADILHADSLYREAAMIDTTFWLAAYKYRQARGWYGRTIDTVIVNRLNRNRDRLPERERAMLAVDTFRTVDGKLAAMREITARYSTYAPAWMMLGDYQMHWAPYMGHATVEALPALRRWAELMPGDLTALGHVGQSCLQASLWACAYTVKRGVDSLFARSARIDGEAVMMRSQFRMALDSTLDSAAYAADTVLRAQIGILSFDRLGIFAERPWLAQVDPLLPPEVPASFRSAAVGVFEVMRSNWSPRSTAALELLVTMNQVENLAPLRLRVAARAAELNVQDATLDAEIERAVEGTSTRRRAELLYYAAQSRLRARDMRGVDSLMGVLQSDTSYAARVVQRSVRAQQALMMGKLGAVDSLLAVEWEPGARQVVYSATSINRLLIADSLLARGEAALVDSLTRYLEVLQGNASTGQAATGVAPRLLLTRARALEQLGQRDEALKIARGMSVVLRSTTEPSRALKAEYAAMAARLSASRDARTPTMVPPQR